ncbi:2-polyprenyl-6-methoxyphenol hydroxylase-like FAD-dependent oxidoreductase [Isoptericola sp. CG 20/1183]|uniref:2-polyprenyl-6-methoxyphenol hydroxylase-like FAD-dependent oxidoreductase n=1 Tax=Isoptericola halotolerans TaxID=300560 RepID=A0ABX5EJ61_9MICO|nr:MULTISPECIES: FAD-dependent monooxygenase [Isoptericola]PRZ09644.1 2-polyprenyl-6-methoxyphenol hydroxylase-like FAD-dependent oxidoreductase [Isoptericola sp. CG 20/1183]PRZ10445.1 2-polyprenyl-6-methoxyphenol hydroxylase-like FAD-dependent oxidoreductase [Isoptericola halotolerans]
MTTTRSAVVVGAGIGGLTAAVALRRRGWDVSVLERAASLEPVGAGIALAPNALRALEAVGAGDRVHGLASLQGAVGIRRPDGAWLVRGDTTMAGAGSTVLLHRAQLVSLLTDELPGAALRLGAEVTGVVAGGPTETATVTTRDHTWHADLVVAADGIDSPMRAVLFPDHPGPAYTGVTAWRFVSAEPAPVELAETWGRGAVVGLMPLADGRVYGYLTATAPPGTRSHDEAAELRRRFAGWHDPLDQLLGALEPGQVLHHDLRWLRTPLPRYDVGRVAFVGDAAHAMTPNLGQGGAQAIEDAVVLAATVDAAGPDRVEAALASYTDQRRDRTRRIARTSARVGAVTRWRSPVAVGLRDLGLRTVGRWAMPRAAKGLESILGWRPPA